MFYCKYCEDEFADAKQLKKHEKICDCNPANARIEKYVCRYCHGQFSSKEQLSKHMQNCRANEKDIKENIEEE